MVRVTATLKSSSSQRGSRSQQGAWSRRVTCAIRSPVNKSTKLNSNIYPVNHIVSQMNPTGRLYLDIYACWWRKHISWDLYTMQIDTARLMETADPSRYVAEDLESIVTVLHHYHLLLPLSLTPHSQAFYSAGKIVKQTFNTLPHKEVSLTQSQNSCTNELQVKTEEYFLHFTERQMSVIIN